MSRVFRLRHHAPAATGSQGEGVNFSLQDKLLITRKASTSSAFDFVEGGYPLSNPKDFELLPRSPPA